MGTFHMGGLLFGAVVTAASKLFWVSACYAISETHEFFDVTICKSFENFFFFMGILIMVLSFLGLLKKIFT